EYCRATPGRVRVGKPWPRCRWGRPPPPRPGRQDVLPVVPHPDAILRAPRRFRPPGDDGPLRSPASSTLPHRDAPAVSSFLCPSSHSPFGRLTNSLALVRVAKAPPAPCREWFGAA